MADSPGSATRRRAQSRHSPSRAQSPAPLPSRPPVDHQPFLDAIQQLVDNGTITAGEAEVVDREIVAGRVDTDTLASSGFTAAQLQAVQQALGNAKRALAAAVPRPSK